MTELLNWPSPDVANRRLRQRLALGGIALALVSLVAAIALVHGFDVVASDALGAQLATQGSPLHGVSCVGYSQGSWLPLPDWRALTIWGLAMSTAVAGWVARRATVQNR